MSDSLQERFKRMLADTGAQPAPVSEPAPMSAPVDDDVVVVEFDTDEYAPEWMVDVELGQLERDEEMSFDELVAQERDNNS